MPKEDLLRLSCIPSSEWNFELTWMREAEKLDFVSDEERVLIYQQAKQLFFKREVEDERKKN